MQELNLKLEHFEGPLSLLIHLIDKNDIDLYNIEISIITEQFIEYLETMEKLNMDISSEFVLMASHLLEIKSKMILPGGENAYKDLMILDGEDPRYDLVMRLIEYKNIKQRADELSDLYLEYGARICKQKKTLKQKTETKFIEDDKILDAKMLKKIFQELISKMPEFDFEREKYFKVIKKESLKIEDFIKLISDRLFEQKVMSFFEFTEDIRSKEAIIVSFISILELVRKDVISAYQEHTHSDIILKCV